MSSLCRCGDTSREAPHCAVCIVTWNFSFELVLFCFVWTGDCERPPYSPLLQRQHLVHGDGPSHTAHKLPRWDAFQTCLSELYFDDDDGDDEGRENSAMWFCFSTFIFDFTVIWHIDD